MDRELQQAKEAQRKLAEFADSCIKSAHTWQQEYLRMLRHEGAHKSCVKVFKEAVSKSLEKLDMQSVQNALILDVIESLTAALSINERFELNSVEPVWLISDPDSMEAFIWKADLDGHDINQFNGKFTNPLTQAMWEGWRAGVKLAGARKS